MGAVQMKERIIALPDHLRTRTRVAFKLKEKKDGEIGLWELHSTKGWRKKGDYFPGGLETRIMAGLGYAPQ